MSIKLKNIKPKIEEIEGLIGINFTDKSILIEAFTHPSLKCIHGYSYQRLEFLGDAILGSVISDILYKKFLKDTEGDLSKKKISLVCGDTLAKITKRIGINKYIIMDDGEQKSGGEEKKSTLEDLIEALIGAIYLNSGFEIVKQFICKYWDYEIQNLTYTPRDPRSILQEWAQKNYTKLPVYQVIQKDGPDHNPQFTVSVEIEGLEKLFAVAKSKKSAEAIVADLMIKKLNIK